MPILAPLLAYVGRFAGKLVEMAFGWATVLLFGRIPQSKRLLLSVVTLGSTVWAAALVGVVLPNSHDLVKGATPALAGVPNAWIRLGILVAVIVLPLAIGVAGLFLTAAEERPSGGAAVLHVFRGYPYTLVLAFTLAFLIVVAPLRKLRTIVKRWEDAHIPVLVRPRGYERVADDLENALDRAGLGIERAKASAVLEMPSKLLAAVGGGSVRQLVPDRLIVLKNRGLEVTIYPSDIAMAGTKEQVARARAAVASTLTFTSAYQTTSREAQEIEDRLEAIGKASRALPWQALEEIDAKLARLVVPYEDWEVLYRQRLQVERTLHRRADRLEAANGWGPVEWLTGLIRRLVGQGS